MYKYFLGTKYNGYIMATITHTLADSQTRPNVLRSDVSTAPASGLYVKIQRHVVQYSAVREIYYTITLATKDNSDQNSDHKWFGSADYNVFTKRVPKRWAEDLETYVMNMKRTSTSIKIGHIHYYTIGPGLVASISYYPKEGLAKGLAVGFPYFLEATIIHDLEKMDVQNTSTSLSPSPLRGKQLSRAGLPTFTNVAIRDWLKGMGRGIQAIKKESEFW